MNDTMGPQGLVPTLLVFGTLPRFPSPDSTYPMQAEGLQALEASRREMLTIVSDQCVKQALHSRLPRCVSFNVNPGELVRIYRESDKKYVGPYKVISTDGKQVTVLVGNRSVHHSLHQLLPEKTFEKLPTADNPISTLFTSIKQFRTSTPSKTNAY